MALPFVVFLLAWSSAGQSIHTVDLGGRTVTLMLTDYQRPFVYAVEPGAAGARGNLLFVNTATEALTRVIPLSTNPTDMTINYAEARLYVTDWLSGSLRVVDLVSQVELAPLPVHVGLDRVNAGRAGRVVMEDWNQWIGIYIYETTNASILANGLFREGDGEIDPTGRFYYHCDNNISSAAVSKWDLSADTWNLVRGSDTGHPFGSRHLLLSPDGSRVFWRGFVYDSDLIEQRGLGNEVYATTLHGELAFSSSQVFNVNNGQVVYSLPHSSSVMAVANEQDKLLLYNPSARNLSIVPMSLIAGGVTAATLPTPTNGQVVPLPMTRLSWSLSPMAAQYEVYFGTDAAAVAAATTNSPLHLATTIDPFVTLTNPLAVERTYYWRVDSVGFQSTIPGPLWRFTVAAARIYPESLELNTVTGVQPADASAVLTLTSANTPWIATSSVPWVSVSPAAGQGTTRVNVSFNATELPAGLHTGHLLFTAAGLTVPVTVSLDVAPMNLIRLLPDPARPNVLYGLHSDGTYTNRGVLLRINATTEQVEQALTLGVQTSDIDIDRAEDALYGINFHLSAPSISRVDLASFTVTTNVSFPKPPDSGGNQYDIKAGPGNLVYWVDGKWAPAIHVMDFSTGEEVGVFDDGEGVGDIVLTADGHTMFASRQFGWSAGNINSWMRKLDTRSLNPVWVQNSTTGMSRDPLDSPLLMPNTEDRVIRNQFAFSTTNLAEVLVQFGNEIIYAISPAGEFAFSPDSMFHGRTGERFHQFPFSSTVVAWAGQPEKIFRFNPATRTIVALSFRSFTNLPPVGRNLSLATVEEGELPVILAGTDPENDPLTFTVETLPTGGVLSGSVPNLLYRPNSNFFGSDSFTYRVADQYRSSVATVTITVTNINDPPTANPQSVLVTRGIPRAITLAGSDVDDDALSFLVVAPPLHGALAGNPPELTYSSAVGYQGTDRFSFKVNDGRVDSATVIVELTVNPPPCISVPAGVVSWWRAEGNAADWAGGNASEPVGALTFGSGKSGQGFAFNGTTAGLLAPAWAASALGSLTVEMWIAPSALDTNQPLADWSASAYSRGPVLALSVASNGAPAAQLVANLIDTNNVSHVLTSLPLVRTGAWQHVALVYNRQNAFARLYYNGAVVAQANVGSFNARTTQDFHLGFQPWPGGGRFNGLMDEPAVYGRALSDAEVQSLFLADDSGKCVATRAPVFTLQPTSQTVVEGSAVLFSAVASGTGPLAFQWLFNNQPLPGSRSPTLLIDSTSLADAGPYRLVVTNAFGTATSQVAQLTVARASAITNGSFETGNFAGWLVRDIAQPLSPLSVRTAGYSPGFDLFSNAPSAGNYSATLGFDGAGPGTIRIAQDTRIPTGHPVLTFDWRAGWDLVSFASATQPRTFSVAIGPAGGGVAWQTNVLLVASPGTRVPDTGLRKGLVPLWPFAGVPARISFDASVPESFTGPGFISLDNVDVVDAPPVAVAIAELSPGLGAGLRLRFAANPTRPYRVEASTNLTTWVSLGLASHLGGGMHEFFDSTTPRHPASFYRVVWP